MALLLPCPACARHVRRTEASCPFCASPLALQGAPAPVLPSTRLGRAATFAFGAAMATNLSACAMYGGPPETDTGPRDAMTSEIDGGTDVDAASEDDAAVPVDAAMEDGGLVAAYGGPPTDSGISDIDAGGSSSDYGAPPPP